MTEQDLLKYVLNTKECEFEKWTVQVKESFPLVRCAQYLKNELFSLRRVFLLDVSNIQMASEKQTVLFRT